MRPRETCFQKHAKNMFPYELFCHASIPQGNAKCFCRIAKANFASLETKLTLEPMLGRVAKLGNIWETCASYGCFWKHVLSFCQAVTTTTTTTTTTNKEAASKVLLSYLGRIVMAVSYNNNNSSFEADHSVCGR